MEFGQEPFVNVGHLPDLVDAVPTMESGGDSEDALVSRVHELFINVFNKIVL